MVIPPHIDVQNSKREKGPYRKITEQEVQQMAKDGITDTKLMGPKPGQSIRFCCDFHGLNEVTVKDFKHLQE